ncbi:MAG TPA: carboxypeptidase regulatory-like domain-containing protein, partial [Pyrinomonadaceae bacterium]|nr:carboxypeptidase regulatory-like domain-containing protein [Pyrinomonadaceae bacterium]
AMSDAEIVDISNASASGVCKTLGNDNFANAQVLNGSSGKIAGFNLRATKEAGEPNHAGSAGGASVWYRWQAPFTGAVNFSTVLSDFDTVLAVYTGSSVNTLTPVAANDDSASGNNFNTPELTSSLTFNAVAGTTYYIAVDGAQGRAGRISLGWGADVSISGQVSPGHYSLVLELSGDDHRAAPFVAANGTYNFQHLRAGGNYRLQLVFYHEITGSQPCFSPPLGSPPTFSPLTGSVANLNFTFQSDDCGSFAGTIAGLVKRSNGVGLPGVTITITSSSFTRTVITSSTGSYDAPNLPNGTSYTVTPSSPNLTFTPPNIMGNSDFDVLNADFTASDTVTISGQTRNGSAPLSGTTVSISGTRAFALTTDANGYYTTEVPAGGSYTVTPSRTGATFTPPNFTFNGVSTNQKNVDFTAASGVLRIDSMSRRAGSTAGGQQVILTGAFANLSTVMLGGVNANWAYTNGAGDTTQITVTTPARSTGAVSFDLLPSSGASYTKPNVFAYLPTVFTDDPLVVGMTKARAQHILELRQAIDALRLVAGLQPAPWTDPTLTPQSSRIRAAHITELRQYLDEVEPYFGIAPPPPYLTDPTLGAGMPIKRNHIEELRQRIRNLAGN